jgi:hypothetical protein
VKGKSDEQRAKAKKVSFKVVLIHTFIDFTGDRNLMAIGLEVMRFDWRQ